VVHTRVRRKRQPVLKKETQSFYHISLKMFGVFERKIDEKVKGGSVREKKRRGKSYLMREKGGGSNFIIQTKQSIQ